MKECGVSEETLLGHICRQDKRKIIESCQYYQLVLSQPVNTLPDLLDTINENHGCSFEPKIKEIARQRMVDYIHNLGWTGKDQKPFE